MCVMTNIKYLIFLNIKIRAIWVTWALADLTKCFLKQYGVVLKSGAVNPKQPIVWVRFDLTSSVERRGFRWLFIQLPAQKAMKNRFDWWASIETLSSPDACFFWFEAICGLSRGGQSLIQAGCVPACRPSKHALAYKFFFLIKFSAKLFIGLMVITMRKF